MIGKLLRQPWVFSFGAAIAVWLATIAYTEGQGAGAILTAALSFATFTIIVGLGQMMVITTGPGNVDLSIPATITLSGVVAMKAYASTSRYWRVVTSDTSSTWGRASSYTKR